MFELTNEQRKYFALQPVSDSWDKVEVKSNQFDMYYTYAYLDGQKIVKVIQVYDEPGHEMYREYSVNETLSEDMTKLLPKTAKGNPQNFTSSNLEKRTPVGMELAYSHGYVAVSNNTNEQSFYTSSHECAKINSFSEFTEWINNWCTNSTEKDLEEIYAFASQPKIHQKYREGDFFRYKINRSLYGYGRILLDFARMRKENISFWDIFMGKPLCVAVYHIVTEKDDLAPDDLVGLKMLPSQMIMDNIFYYGECKIIGNMPVTSGEEDYPIHYGNSIDVHEPNRVNYQCGRTFISLEHTKQLYSGFRNGGVGWTLNVTLPILNECIKSASNAPYWKMISSYKANQDLRNPKLHQELNEIQKQMNIAIK